jgi:malic enzyme
VGGLPPEAVAVAKMAMKQGVARLTIDEKELYNMAATKIRRAQEKWACSWRRAS